MSGLSRSLIAALLAAMLALGLANASAAIAQGPWWRLESRAAPTNLSPGGEGQIIVSASNVGDADADGGLEPITIADTLPEGVQASAISGRSSFPEELPMSCSLQSLSCSYSQDLVPFDRLEMTIQVRVSGGEGVLSNTVQVHGGGAPAPAPFSGPVKISSQPTPFGVERLSLSPEEEGGAADTQAGSHPYQLTTTFDVNQILAPALNHSLQPQAPALVRDLSFHLPPGLVGNPTAAPQCGDVDFATISQDGLTDLCPADTAVGVAVVTINEPEIFSFTTIAVPVFNLTPARGEPARFGFEVFKVPVVLDTAVKSREGYAVSVSVSNASQAAAILGTQVTFWGQPGAQSHDASRGWACLDLPHGARKECQPAVEHSPDAFLTLPTSCSGQALQVSVDGDSWPTAGAPQGLPLQSEPSLMPALAGCEALPFAPSIATEPDQHSASTPSGMTVGVTVPQQSTVLAGGLAEAAVKDTTVTLPAGVQVNPAAAGGLLTCSSEQVGLDPGAAEEAQIANESFSEALPSCPEAAKVATVQIMTPLLDHELQGEAFLASQDTDPFASPLVLYLLVHDPVSGVQVKLAGTVTLDPATGQLTSTFANTPQLPFEELKLHFFDGQRASLSTPPRCGAYLTNAGFTPWSGGPTRSASASFAITAGAGGGSCPSDPLPFAPALVAQSANPQAGAFSPFTLAIQRPDGQQALEGLTIHLPAGVAAMLSSITPCPEAQAAANQCPPESEIGQSIASAGPGGEPFTLPGHVYLTGPYEGAPFGLSVVTPAVAGPFNLGDVTVRSKILVDPHTAAVTISSDPLPTIIKGVPVQLKQINVDVDRPDFEFNPTSCNAMSIQATLGGAEGANANVSSPFQVSGCQGLPFEPGVTATTQGQTSKADGASLGLTFRSKTGEAHVAKTILTIPATLPARLTTIQKACVASVFEANPAGCPEGSDIGAAIVHTPVLKSPLSGPIYLVSHGNAAWPDAELVLQGEGVTVILDGQTAIKKGVTTSSFLSVPDAPFESVEATLPEGPHSALTTNLPLKDKYSLCGQKLTIPTSLTGQNGTVVNETVKVAVQDCHAVKANKAKKFTRAQKLAKALKTCRRRHARSAARRATCERAARRRYAGNSRVHETRRNARRIL
ncbi:MAG TPA: hypothetical protein VMB51_04600 [Solirubrobacteraceae bacterium]|nr:hypothetical protein [Solirubrobacteraceae bacterium]